MIKHWMTSELRGANGMFQRAAREYAEEYAEMAVAEERKRCADLCRRPPGWLSADQLIIATEIQLAILKG